MANTEGRDVMGRLRAMASGEKAGELGEQEAAALLAVVEAAKEFDRFPTSENRMKFRRALACLYDGSSGETE